MKYTLKLKLSLGIFSGSVAGEIATRPSVRMPGLMRLNIFSEENEMLQFNLVLDAVAANDVVTRELTLKVGEAEPVVVELPGDAMDATGFECEDNTVVNASLVDVDDAGNRSEPRVQSWTVTDTIAPPVPGEMGLVVTGEV